MCGVCKVKQNFTGEKDRQNHCDALKSIWCTTNTGKYFYTLTAGVMANNTKAMIKMLKNTIIVFQINKIKPKQNKLQAESISSKMKQVTQ